MRFATVREFVHGAEATLVVVASIATLILVFALVHVLNADQVFA